MRRFALMVFFGLVATAALSLLFAQAYQFVLASEEARTAVVVTEELGRELYAATYASDLIAFAILGAVLSAVMALACSTRSSTQQKAAGAGVGLVLGAAGGALGAMLGHWYVLNMQWQLDPMVQWALRWALVLLPIAIAAALATAAAGNFRRDIGNAVSGAIVGTMIAAVVFALLHGIVAQTENFSVVMPAFIPNRVLIVAAAVLGIGTGLVWQVKEPRAVADASSPTAGEVSTSA